MSLKPNFLVGVQLTGRQGVASGIGQHKMNKNEEFYWIVLKGNQIKNEMFISLLLTRI